MKQQTLTGFEKYGKTTRRAQFLSDMDRIIPWPEVTAAVARVYPNISEQGGRPVNGLPDLAYPFHDRTITVTRCGRICMGPLKINLSQVFAGQAVGVREVTDHIWLISFMHYDLGFFDDQCTRVECAPNPFSAKVSAMCPV
jgi:hypothetical protein